MPAITPQHIEDYADPPPPESPAWMRSRQSFWAWWGLLAICPLLMLVLRIAFEQPPGKSIIPFSWPAQAVEVLALAHLGLSSVAAIAAFWVWGRHRWWLGWISIFFAFFLAFVVCENAYMATNGAYR